MTNERDEIYVKYESLVDKLYEFRDKYYILNKQCTPEDRVRDLNTQLNEVVQQLDNAKENFESLASYLTLSGRAFNVIPEYSQKAFDSLTKAVKMDPKCYEAWNYLGECYWKKRDFESAKNCFTKSLTIKKNKLSLRCLSMVTRQLSSKKKDNLAELKQLIDESVRHAKEALQLDMKDGMSWYILGNSYLTQFFSPFRRIYADSLKQAITAYNFALKDEQVASLQSDLYFNKYMTSLYAENWSDALYCLTKTLELDPTWIEVKEYLKGALNYLSTIQDLVNNNGRLKLKKFQSLINSINDTDLGPYLVGYQPKGDDSNKIDLVTSCLNDLKKGQNRNKVLIGKVVSGMPTVENFNLISFTCCIADKNGDCAVLTIYNLVNGEGVIIGDSIAIPEPWIENVNFTYELPDCINLSVNQITNNFKFCSIRVETPSVLVVNGKKWTKDKVSSTVIVPKVISD
jgi:tetratricopeptide (TPR) repeat protein